MTENGGTVKMDETESPSTIPASIPKQFEFIDFNNDGNLLLSASHLTGRHWTGGLFVFTNADDAGDISKLHTGHGLLSGAAEAKWISDTQCATGTDSGELVLCKVDDGNMFVLGSRTEHDDMVTSLSVSAQDSTLLTASDDRKIKVWDLEQFHSTNTYKAHVTGVTCVCAHPAEPHVFASCERRGRLLTWDTRQGKPASVIDVSWLPAGAQTLAWQPGRPVLAVGGRAGGLGLADLRSAGKPCWGEPAQPHTRGVNQLSFCPADWRLAASVSDDCTVSLFNTESQLQIWSDDSHRDMVRSEAWSPVSDRLYTCAWDGAVKGHAPPDLGASGDGKVIQDVTSYADKVKLQTEVTLKVDAAAQGCEEDINATVKVQQ